MLIIFKQLLNSSLWFSLGKQNKKNKGKKFKTPPASASKTDKKGKKKESKKSQEERKKELVSAETARTDSRVSEGKTKEIDYVPVEREVVIGGYEYTYPKATFDAQLVYF